MLLLLLSQRLKLRIHMGLDCFLDVAFFNTFSSKMTCCKLAMKELSTIEGDHIAVSFNGEAKGGDHSYLVTQIMYNG